ncbi:MAG TPA: RtcB family protein [Acidimicrobiia bacterium]|nr:RtcB family protein [Acidimicrobiia bacterium]
MHRLDDKLICWASEIDEETLAQARRVASLPFVVGHVALMPDAHLGKGATVGSVIPTEGAIVPAAVGVDIGCGMIAVETDLGVDDLPADLYPLLRRIERRIPAGVGKGHEAVRAGSEWLERNPNDTLARLGLEERAAGQFGSLGAGNHFVEVCRDPAGTIWAVLHSGSRGPGNRLAEAHIEIARRKCRGVDLPDRDLAYLTEGTPEFDEYLGDLDWAQGYAFANRSRMMDLLLGAIAETVGRTPTERRRINCHHNYTAREQHMGREVWLTRKGAIRAGIGDHGVIAGSMGTPNYIVRGKGNPLSFSSCAHGAGRRMSRTAARKKFTPGELSAAMAGRTWLADRVHALLDEAPGSYKDIGRVMQDQKDLVEVEVVLDQMVNYKGT